MNTVITTCSSTDDLINKLQELKGNTKLKFHKNMSNYYDIMKIKMDEDPFAKNGQSINDIYHEVLMLIKCLQTKPQVKNMNNNHCDLYYTVIKNRVDKKILDHKYEND